MGREKISLGGGINSHIFERIISLENLFTAWKEFRKGKRKKTDVREFEMRLEDRVFDLHYALKNGSYQHSGYKSFYVNDPKRRHIHKASVKDRLVHHAVVRVLTPLFERKFIFDSWSCRKGKGTHRAVRRFQDMAWRLSRNNTRTVWVLKLDIRKCFASVSHEILLKILTRTIRGQKALDLCEEIIKSFSNGLPLGNLTSQLFVNIYLNELDQFVKHELKARAYLRYSDDFALLDLDRNILSRRLEAIRNFLENELQFRLHTDKIILEPYYRGIDFLGFICFPHFCILRTKTKRRMFKRFSKDNASSYLGLLKHCRSRKLRVALLGL